MVSVRRASAQDVPAIASIYNQGIEDGVATLEYAPKTLAEMGRWFEAHDERYAVLAACAADEVVGWASLNSYSHRCASTALRTSRSTSAGIGAIAAWAASCCRR